MRGMRGNCEPEPSSMVPRAGSVRDPEEEARLCRRRRLRPRLIRPFPTDRREYLDRARRASVRSCDREGQEEELGCRHTRSMAYHPEVQHAIADIVIEIEG
jgi:hypothetical protein